MNKNELTQQVMNRCGLSRHDAEQAVSAVCDAITEAVAGGERVQLTGFGTFEARQRNPRVGRNPKTGEAVESPAVRVPVFKPGKGLKDAVER